MIGEKLKIYKGDLIFAKRNAYLKRVAIADFDAVASAHSMVLRPRPENVLPEFLPFFLLSEKFWQRAIEISVGSLSPTINWKVLARQEFLLPPKDQQAKLAELLWAMDEVIESYLAVLEKVTSCYNSAVKAKCIEAEGEVQALSKVIDKLVAGVSVNSEEGEIQDSDTGILKTSSVSEWYFIPTEAKRVLKSELHRVKTPVTRNTIIISRMNTVELVGANGFVHNDHPNLFLPDRLWQTRISRNDVNVKYLWYLLSSSHYRHRISSLCTGTSNSMKNISKESLLSIRIALPNKSYQDKIVHKIEHIEYTKKLSSERVTLSKTLQNTIVNKVFE